MADSRRERLGPLYLAQHGYHYTSLAMPPPATKGEKLKQVPMPSKELNKDTCTNMRARYVTGAFHGTYIPLRTSTPPAPTARSTMSEPTPRGAVQELGPPPLGSYRQGAGVAAHGRRAGMGTLHGGQGHHEPGGSTFNSSHVANAGLSFQEATMPAVKKDFHSPTAYMEAYKESMAYTKGFYPSELPGMPPPPGQPVNEVTLNIHKDGWAPYDSPLMDRSIGRLSSYGLRAGEAPGAGGGGKDRVWHGGHGVRMPAARRHRHNLLVKGAEGNTPLYWLRKQKADALRSARSKIMEGWS